jgi:hypothetical protein
VLAARLQEKLASSAKAGAAAGGDGESPASSGSGSGGSGGGALAARQAKAANAAAARLESLGRSGHQDLGAGAALSNAEVQAAKGAGMSATHVDILRRARAQVQAPAAHGSTGL